MPYPHLEARADVLRMLNEITEARRQILARCRRLSAGALQDPVYPGTWSVLQNLAHLAWAEEWMLAWIRRRPHVLPPEDRPPEPPAELDAVATALDEAHAAVIAFLASDKASFVTGQCYDCSGGRATY